MDAVCCLYFCSAGKSGPLVAILTKLGLEILIPEEVEREVIGKRGLGQLAVHRARMASDRVKILPLLMADDERADVVATVAGGAAPRRDWPCRSPRTWARPS